MPKASAKKPPKPRKPPPETAWQSARTLTPTPTERDPRLISDGGGLPFTPSAPFAPFTALDQSDPAVAALIAQIDQGRQLAQPRRMLVMRAKPPALSPAEKLAGWRELARTDEEVLYARGRPPRMLTVAVRRTRKGVWTPLGASNSRPLRAFRDGARASSWRLDPNFQPHPDSSELRILVTEQTLASGTSVTERLLTPELYADDAELILRVYVEPLSGYIGRTAPHETPVVIALAQPVGERRVLDGAVYIPPLT